MWNGIILCLALVFSNPADACFSGRCGCYKDLKVLDCASVNLYEIPQLQSRLDNYTTILLRDNNLQHIDIFTLFEMLPSVMFIDVRENTPLLCDHIMRLQSSKSITIISDCNYSTSHIPTHAITEISTTHEKKTSSTDLSTPSTSRNITTDPVTHSELKTTNGTEMYIVKLILSLLLIPSTTIIIHSIIRCWKTRRCCREELQSQREIFILNPLNQDSHDSCDDKENIIFTRV